MADAVTDVGELLQLLDLSREQVGIGAGAAEVADRYGLRVPRGYVELIQRGNATDPLLRQVLPVDDEAVIVHGFVSDPLDEGVLMGGGRVLRKYRGRALVYTNDACAIHCRYCFRRHISPEHDGISTAGIVNDLEDLGLDPSVCEVILSGGDPFALTDDHMDRICAVIERSPHVRRFRFHTRLPVVLPQRVDEGLLEVLGRRRCAVVVVVHANHARELTSEAEIACAALRASGVLLLNQSVLLQGVNDHPDVLVALSERLFELGVHPYYLHLLDPVAGAAHFDVSEDRARRLVGEAASRLPGYLVPRLVREVPGAPAKVIVPPRF